MRRWALPLTLLALLALAGGLFLALRPAPAPPAQRITAVHVSGNRLVDQAGAGVRLLGVNRSGTEYRCLRSGIFYGPTGEASVRALAAWHLDAVRIPLNEDCWLGINGVNPLYSGAAYRSAVASYVARLNARGLVAILALDWSAPGAELATSGRQMADESHGPAFWSSVAATFRSRPDVLFDLYNEPFGISWSCWLTGCRLAAGWRTAGMQQLVSAVRVAGADQPILVGGLGYASDLSGWRAHEPRDPRHQLVASVHVYPGTGCASRSCWTGSLAPLSRHVPLVAGEIGEYDCGSGYVDGFMAWADRHRVSYLGWAWDTGGGWECATGPSLISSWSGRPTPYGSGLRRHLDQLWRRGTAPYLTR